MARRDDRLTVVIDNPRPTVDPTKGQRLLPLKAKTTTASTFRIVASCHYYLTPTGGCVYGRMGLSNQHGGDGQWSPQGKCDSTATSHGEPRRGTHSVAWQSSHIVTENFITFK